MLEITVNSKSYSGADGDPASAVLADISLKLSPGETVVLLGASGVGKTTLLNIIAGIDEDFEGHCVQSAGNTDVSPCVGYIFQEPRLLPWLTVRQNLALVLENNDPTDPRISAALDHMNLADAEGRLANRLSLGMARRVALARALIIEPDLLLLDEPLSSLDEATGARLREHLSVLFDERSCASLLVTHNVDEAVCLGDRIVMLGGKPAGIADEIQLSRPRPDRDAEWRSTVVDQVREKLAFEE